MFPSFLKKKSVIIFAIIILLGMSALAVFDFAPVISIDGERVGLADFLKVQSAVRHMDMNGNGGVLKLSDEEVKQRVFGNIIDKVFLDKLISQIDTTLDKKADDLVKQSIDQSPNLQLDTAARKLYGLSAEDFKELVLIPQAKRDLLTERFKDNQEQLNQMWEDLVKTADIKVYYPGYKWEGGEIKKK